MEENVATLFSAANIIQGGGVVIALVCLGIIYKLVTNHHVHSDEIIQKNTEAHVQASEKNQRQIEVLEKQTDALNKLSAIIDKRL